jgi:uncharacterized protein
MLERAAAGHYRDMVAARRETVVTGPRQAGKTTLVQSRLGGGTLRSLDDQGTLDSALTDPVGFLPLGPRPLVIDEVQGAGEPLVRAIKPGADRDPGPGQFVLTGSSNFLTVPTISESLAGRAGLSRCGPSPRARSAASTSSSSTSRSRACRVQHLSTQVIQPRRAAGAGLRRRLPGSPVTANKTIGAAG